MIRRQPRSTQSRSSAASDVYKRQAIGSFLPEWWRVTQALTPYLQEDELNFDLKILDIARSTGASYFILIQPKPDELDAIPLQQIVFLNEYAALIRLDQD